MKDETLVKILTGLQSSVNRLEKKLDRANLEKPYLSLEEAAIYMSFRVVTLREWIQAGVLSPVNRTQTTGHYFKSRRRLKFVRTRLDAFMVADIPTEPSEIEKFQGNGGGYAAYGVPN